MGEPDPAAARLAASPRGKRRRVTIANCGGGTNVASYAATAPSGPVPHGESATAAPGNAPNGAQPPLEPVDAHQPGVVSSS